MKRSILVLGVLASIGGVAEAMPADEFAARWRQFDAMPQAQIRQSPDLGPLIAEFSSAGRAYRAEIDQARSQGRQPRACPPERIEFSVDDFIAAVDQMPRDAQTREVAEVFGEILDSRYACADQA
jgi:hypothetical protein